jgi:hypothetical protein
MMPLGADVSRAMKWAEAFDNGGPRRLDQRLPEKPKTAPARSMMVQAPIQEIPEEPKIAAKVMPPKVAMPIVASPPVQQPTIQAPTIQRPPKTPEPVKRPVLLEPETSIHKNDKADSTPSKFKKFFGAKTKEEKAEKAAKRASRATSPMPPSPKPAVVQPVASAVQPQVKPSAIPVRSPPIRSPPTPTPEIAETQVWDEDFDGTHRPTTPQKSEMTSPETPVTTSFPDAIPSRERTSEDSELDRWAQIRKTANQRAMNRTEVASSPNDDEIMEAKVLRVRQAMLASPKRGKPSRDDEEEETVDARVARIRKRVQELTAGMGD